MALITVDIIPDNTVINLFRDEQTVPTESFFLTGKIEITTQKPVNIRQIQIQLKGHIQSIVSLADMIQETSYLPRKYEIPLNQWDTLGALNSSVLGRMSRKILEFSYAYTNIINQCKTIMDESQLLKTGKNQFSFSIEIQHADLLPPTVILPQHSISYYLSAEVKPSSLSERFKVTYRNASMNPLRRKNTQIAPILSSQHNSRSYSLPPTSALLYEQERPSFSDSFQESSSSSVEYNRRDVVFSQLLSHRTMKSLSASRSIQVCQHSYPSLALLNRVSRVRYHGSRQGRLKYRISMPKYACLQKLKYNFQCKFEPLCEEAIIKSVVYYIEQVESYPLRAGNFQSEMENMEDVMGPRKRKYSLTEQDMQDYINSQNTNFSISLDIPHISQMIESPTLKITHKLRLNIRFMDSTKERAMSLSFPLHICTVPKAESTAWNPERISVDNYLERDVSLTYPDLLLMTSEESAQRAQFSEDEYNKLPSYREALHEGAPPSPFLEDNI